MKSLWKIVLISLCFAMIPSKSIALHKTFLGAEMQLVFHKSHLNKVHTIHHINLFTGYKFNEFIGFEVGGYMGENHQILDYFLNRNALHGSLMSHLPLVYGVRMRVGLGATHLTARIFEADGNKVFRKVLPHFIAGLEADLNDHMVGRINIKLEDMYWLAKSHRAFKNDALHLNIGVAYHF